MTLRQEPATGAPVGGYPVAPATPDVPGPAPVVRSAAPARRTRRGAIVSILVVLLGGVMAVTAANVLTTRTDVLAVARDVPVGATITDSDLAVANVTTDRSLKPIPASRRSQIDGQIAQVGLVAGELLTPGQVGVSSGFTPGQMLVAVALKQGQFPARGLSAGQKVLIVSTPGTNGGGTNGAGADKGAGSAGQPIAATVAEVGAMNPASGITVIDLRVSADQGVAVAQLASTGNLALILLPAAG